MEKPIYNNDFAKLLLRLAVGGLMLLHGIDKIQGGVEFIKGTLTAKGMPEFIAYGVYVGEILAPLLILAGFWSRLGGLLVAGTMVMTIVLAHSGDWYTLNQYGALATELNMLYMFGGLALFFGGGGRYALGGGSGRWS
ncbi:MAG: DoxX family protein [Planctomycetota bacterium]|nr:DoxX family protein [Planctomycetota bacterium]